MQRKTAVLVDDEEDVAVFLETALEDAGIRALTASSAAEGMALIRRERPDLICLDVLMPEESGMSLYKKLKTDPALKDIPVIIASGLSMHKELRNVDYRSLEDGTLLPEPEGFIDKPVDAARFLAKVREVLGEAS